MDDVDLKFHAGLLLENPAYKQAIEDERAAIAREMSRLDVWMRDERWAASLALTAVENLERRWRRMAAHGRIEQFHQQQKERVA